MEKFQSSPFLNVWHEAMFYGAIGMFALAVITYIYHYVKIGSLKTPKEKYDFISIREIKNFELIFIFIAIGVAMLINRYGMNEVEEMGVWFFVRLFISVAGGTLIGYIAFLILE